MAASADYDALAQALAAAQADNERLRADLAEAQQSFYNLYENVGDAIFIVDLTSGQILAANTHAARRLGYQPGELVGMPLDAIEVLAGSTDMELLAWESVVSETRIYECQYRHQSGALIPMEVSSRVVHWSGRPVLQNFVRTIAVRKQWEAERAQLIADLDSYAHTVAHDLKNPLGVVMGYADFIRDALDDLSADDLRKYLQQMVISTQKAVSIIDALLLFASVRQQAEVPREPLDMAAIVNDAVGRLTHPIERSGAQIHVMTPWPTALGYAPWVAELWTNYLSNAIKYGGTPPRIEIGATIETAGQARFWVRDHGPGIPAAKLNLLFEKFSRVGDVRVEGHGLGLSITKRIAEKLGGFVSVTSAEGVGSTFSFTLPLA